MNNCKRIFLVDTLNIQDYSFINLMKLSSEDLVYLFKTDCSRKLDLSEMEYLIKSKCNIEYIDLATNNYTNMSMFISFYLGRLLSGMSSDCEVFIVSNTSNFDSLIKFIELPNRVVHLDEQQLENVLEENFYNEDVEEVSIFPGMGCGLVPNKSESDESDNPSNVEPDNESENLESSS